MDPLRTGTKVIFALLVVLMAAFGGPLGARPARMAGRQLAGRTIEGGGRRGLSLSGVWDGSYAYDAATGLPPVAFLAVIDDVGGDLDGDIEEPAEDGQTRHARLDGWRSGREVVFTKSYDGRSDWDHKVEYAGEANEAGDEIHGRWHLFDVAGAASGTFSMHRRAAHVQQADLRQAAAEVELVR